MEFSKLDGFVFDLQRFSKDKIEWDTVADKSYYKVIDPGTDVSSTTVDLSANDWDDTGLAAVTDKILVKVTVNGKSIKEVTYQPYDSDATDWSDTSSDYTGTVATGGIGATEDTYTFSNAANYTLDTTGIKSNLVVTTGFGAGDKAVVASGQTISLNNDAVTGTAEDSGATIQYRDSGEGDIEAGYVLSSGSFQSTKTDATKFFVGDPPASTTQYVEFTQNVTIASTGDVTTMPSGGTVTSNVPSKTITTSELAVGSNGTYTVNGNAFTVTVPAAGTATTSVFTLSNTGALDSISGILAKDSVTVDLADGISAIKIGTAAGNVKEFTAAVAGSELGFLMTDNDSPALTSGTITAAAESLLGNASDSTKTTSILLTDVSAGSKAPSVTVDGANYQISDLEDTDTVTIGGTTYTYNAGQLLYNGTGFVVKEAGSISFETGGTTIANTSAINYVGDVTDLTPFVNAADGTWYFRTDGKQQYNEASGNAYTLQRATSESTAYTLTGTANATATITIAAAGVKGLTLNLAETNAARTVTVDNTTTIENATLGTEDNINGLATSTQEGSTLSMAENQAVTLKTGKFAVSTSNGVTVESGVLEASVASKGYIDVTNGSVKLDSNGRISEIGVNDAFTIYDAGGTNSTTIRGISEKTASLNGVAYTSNANKTLADAYVDMVASGGETEIATMSKATGIDFDAASGTQWFKLGTDTGAGKQIANLDRIVDSGYFEEGTYYAVYTATTKTLSIGKYQDKDTLASTSEYEGELTVDLGGVTAFNIDEGVKAALTNVTGTSTINTYPMTGIETAVTVNVGNNGSISSINGLANNEGVGEEKKLPENVTVALKSNAANVSVNGRLFAVTAASGNVITTTSDSSYLYNGTATLSYTGGDTPAELPFGSASNAKVTLTSSDKSTISTKVTVSEGNVSSVGGNDGVPDRAVLTVHQANGSVSTVDSGTFQVNGNYYSTESSILRIVTSNTSSALSTGTAVLTGTEHDLTIGKWDTETSQLVTANTLTLTDVVTTDSTSPSATVSASDGTLASVTLGADGTGISGVTVEMGVTATSAGTYAVNGIQFTTTASGAVASADAVTNANTLTVDQTITTGTANKNYTVSGIEYTKVSDGVKLSSTDALLATEDSVTVSSHDALTGVTVDNTNLIKIDAATGAVSKVASNGTSAAAYVATDAFTLGSTSYTFAAKDEGKTGNIKLTIGGSATNAGTYNLTTDEAASLYIADVSGDVTDTVKVGGSSGIDIGSYVGSLADLKTVAERSKTSTTYFFDNKGVQLADSTGAAYTFQKTSDAGNGAYTLTSLNIADASDTGAITLINAASVTGLTVNLSAAVEGKSAANLQVADSTVITAGSLGTNSVTDGTNTLATGVTGATFTYDGTPASGKSALTLTAGTFSAIVKDTVVTTGTDISTESSVIYAPGGTQKFQITGESGTAATATYKSDTQLDNVLNANVTVASGINVNDGTDIVYSVADGSTLTTGAAAGSMTLTNGVFTKPNACALDIDTTANAGNTVQVGPADGSRTTFKGTGTYVATGDPVTTRTATLTSTGTDDYVTAGVAGVVLQIGAAGNTYTAVADSTSSDASTATLKYKEAGVGILTAGSVATTKTLYYGENSFVSDYSDATGTNNGVVVNNGTVTDLNEGEVVKVTTDNVDTTYYYKAEDGKFWRSKDNSVWRASTADYGTNVDILAIAADSWDTSPLTLTTIDIGFNTVGTYLYGADGKALPADATEGIVATVTVAEDKTDLSNPKLVRSVAVDGVLTNGLNINTATEVTNTAGSTVYSYGEADGAGKYDGTFTLSNGYVAGVTAEGVVTRTSTDDENDLLTMASGTVTMGAASNANVTATGTSVTYKVADGITLYDDVTVTTKVGDIDLVSLGTADAEAGVTVTREGQVSGLKTVASTESPVTFADTVYGEGVTVTNLSAEGTTVEFVEDGGVGAVTAGSVTLEKAKDGAALFLTATAADGADASATATHDSETGTTQLTLNSGTYSTIAVGTDISVTGDDSVTSTVAANGFAVRKLSSSEEAIATYTATGLSDISGANVTARKTDGQYIMADNASTVTFEKTVTSPVAAKITLNDGVGAPGDGEYIPATVLSITETNINADTEIKGNGEITGLDENASVSVGDGQITATVNAVTTDETGVAMTITQDGVTAASGGTVGLTTTDGGINLVGIVTTTAATESTYDGTDLTLNNGGFAYSKGTAKVDTTETKTNTVTIDNVVFNGAGSEQTIGTFAVNTATTDDETDKAVTVANTGNVSLETGNTVTSVTMNGTALTTTPGTVAAFDATDDGTAVTGFTAGTINTAESKLSMTPVESATGSFTLTSGTAATSLNNVVATMANGSIITGFAESVDDGSIVTAKGSSLSLTKGQFTSLSDDAVVVSTTAAAGTTVVVDKNVTFTAKTNAAAAGTFTKAVTGDDPVPAKAALTSTAVGDSLKAAVKGTELTVVQAYTTEQVNTVIEYYDNKAGLLVAGQVVLDGKAVNAETGESVDVSVKVSEEDKIGTVTNTGTAAIKVADNGEVTWDTPEGVSFTTTDPADGQTTTYTVYGDNNDKVAVEYGGVATVYNRTGIGITIDEDGNYKVTGTEVEGDDINVGDAITAKGDKYYTATGVELPNASGAAVDVVYKAGATTEDPDTVALTLNRDVTAGVIMTGAEVTAVNGADNFAANYNVDDSIFTANASFSVSENVITGAIVAKTADGKYALGDGSSSVTFEAAKAGETVIPGLAPEGANVTLAGDLGTVILTEADNLTAANDTKITGNGAISGIDGDATVVVTVPEESETVTKITVKTDDVDNFDFNVTNIGVSNTNFAVEATSGGEITFNGINEVTDLKDVTVTMKDDAVIAGFVASDADSSVVTATGTALSLTEGSFTSNTTDTINVSTTATKDTTVVIDGVTFKAGNDTAATGTFTAATSGDEATPATAVLTSENVGDSLATEEAGPVFQVKDTQYNTTANGTTVANAADGAQLTAGEVSFAATKNLIVGATTYTAAGDGATIDYNSGSAKLTAGTVALDNTEAIVIGATTYTATKDETVMDVTNGLTAGEVSFASDATLKVGDAAYTAGAGGATINFVSANVGELTSGTVSIAANAELKVGDHTYTAGAGGATIDYNDGTAQLTAGSVILDRAEESIIVSNKGTLTNIGSVAISVDSSGNITNTSATDGKKFVGGEVFTTIDPDGKSHQVKYSIKTGAKKVSAVQIADTTDETPKKDARVYAVGTGVIAVVMNKDEGAFTNEIVKSAQAGELSGVDWDTGVTSEIDPVAEINDVKYYDEIGIAIADTDPDKETKAAIKIDGTRTPKTVEIKKAVDDSLPAIELTGANVSVSDSTKTCTFEIKEATVACESFDVNEDNVITSATGTIALTGGSITTSVSNAVVNMTGAGSTSAVYFTDDTQTSNAEITTKVGKITVSENGTGNVTTVYNDGSIYGLNGDATITGAVNGTTIQVYGDGNTSINGVEYTVSGNEGSPVLYTVDTTQKAKINAVSGLATDATLSTTAVFTDEALVIGGNSFIGVTSKDGLEVKKTGTDTTTGNDTLAINLNQKGEGFTSTAAGLTFTMEAAGSASAVTITTGGAVSGLKDGDKVTMTDGTTTYTYEVVNGVLNATYDDGSGATSTNPATTTYSLASGDDSFSIKVTGAGKYTCSGEAGQAVTGTKIGTSDTTLTSVSNGTMVDSDGKITSDSSKAAATLATDDGTVDYKATDKARETDIKLSNSNTTDWNIDTTASNKKTDVEAGVDGTGAVNNAVNLTAGAGKTTANVNSNVDSNITGGSGDLTATVGGTGSHKVTGGSGENKLTDNSTGDTELIGGSGKNEFTSTNSNGKIVGGEGENIVNMSNGVTNTMENYTFGKDTLKTGNTINTDNLKVSEGTIKEDDTGTKGGVNVSSGTGTDGFYAVTIKDGSGKKYNVGWTGDNGGEINASEVSEDLVLIGDQNEDAADLLRSGSGNDEIYVGENDSVDSGTGNNKIHMSTTNKGARYVGFGTAGAKDEVMNFQQGFDANDADSIVFMNNASMLADDASGVKVTYDGTDVVLKSGTSRMTLDKMVAKTTTNAVELLLGGQKVAAAANGKTINADDVNYADAYFGTGSVGLSFAKADGDVSVNLTDTEHYRGISSVTGGTEHSTLMGGSGSSTLTSAGGNTSLYGGTGNALLVGKSGARDEFFFFGESGKDTISGFEAGTSATSDVLNLFGSSLNEIKTTSAGLEISTTATSKVVVSGIKADNKVQWTSNGASGVAKIGSRTDANKFTYEADVNTYMGGNKTDTISVSGSDGADVWLDNVSSGIDVLDASSATGNNTLAGGSAANTIKAGRGNDSLWGGAGSVADTLVAGSGADMFFYGYGEGNDVINGSKSSDSVNLYNVQIADLEGAVIDSTKITVAFKNGQTLTVNGSANEFTLGDGSTWVANRSDGTWSKKD